MENMPNTEKTFEVTASYFRGRVDKRAVVTAKSREAAAVRAVVTQAIPVDYRTDIGPIYGTDFNRQMRRLSSKSPWPEIVSSDAGGVILAWGDDDNAQTLFLSVLEVQCRNQNDSITKEVRMTRDEPHSCTL